MRWTAAGTICLLSLAMVAPLEGQARSTTVPPGPAELRQRLERLLDSLARTGQFSGVVVVAEGDQIAFQKAYGFADRAAARPNTLDTRFNLGSINKLFTGIAVRQLEASGRIVLDSTIAAYWPDYPNADVAHRVTIRQLLAHRAGLTGDIFGSAGDGSRQRLRQLSDVLPLFANQPLAFDPGNRFEYCNVCYVVLGLLVERISGENYYHYVQSHIYAPAGMTATGHIPTDSLPPDAAIGYTNGRTGTLDAMSAWTNTDSLPRRGSSAGGGYTTAPDLLRFVRAARAGRMPGGPASMRIGIAGGTYGVNAILETGMPGGYDLIVLSNLDPPAAFQVAGAMHEWLGLPPLPAP